MSSYGRGQTDIPNTSMAEIEALVNEGYAVLKGLMDANTVSALREKVYDYYKLQEKDFGQDELKAIGELNVLRCPISYDESFFSVLENEKIIEVAQNYLGENFILHLQNAIINSPVEEHHQSTWHRDLPYQNHLISRPLSLNVFLCLTDFTSDNGATYFVKKGHLMENFPSDEELERESFQIEARAGDVLLFDSMIIHRAGVNGSNADRIGLNHVLVKPLLKQQIDLPALFGGKYEENVLRSQLIGYRFAVPKSVKEFRQLRLNRLQNG